MRRVTWMTAIVLGIAVILSGCGTKDAGAVVKELDEMIAKMESYQGVGRMTLHTGQEPQEYQVEVWFKKPHYYRIALTNDKKDITQIVLRNDEGVYVLTPHLNKSFRFQSNWPDNQGQVYLFQSIAESIQMDNERQLTTEENAYVFDVAANYQNASLVRQKVWLDKKTLGPQNIEVTDAGNNVMVTMEFSHFEFNKQFDQDSFDMQRNMNASIMSTTPTIGQGEERQAADSQAPEAGNSKPGESKPSPEGSKQTPKDAEQAPQDSRQQAPEGGKATPGDGKQTPGDDKQTTGDGKQTPGDDKQTTGDGTQTTTDNKQAAGEGELNGADGEMTAEHDQQAQQEGEGSDEPQQQTLVFIDPAYVPEGVSQSEVTEVKLGDGKGLLQRYTGTYNYTLLQSRPVDRAVSVLPTTIVDLGYTLAVLTGEEQKTLVWTYNGVEFRLSSGDLPESEMTAIAQSVQGQSLK